MLTPLQIDLVSVVEGVNLVWVLMVTFPILFMRVGFAMLEAGQIHAKNVTDQLTKNLLTWNTGTTVFFLLGAVMSSIIAALTSDSAPDITGAFIGLYAPNISAMTVWADRLFGVIFAMTAVTTISDAMVGHIRLRTHLTYTISVVGVIYPAVVGLTWDGGFLDALSFHDFTGGMAVHGMGGIAGLTAVWTIGLCMNRFRPGGTVNVIPSHSITFAALGMLIFAFGWYGSNAGTTAASLIYAGSVATLGSFTYIGRVTLMTTLGMAAGATDAGGVAIYKAGEVDTLYVANGVFVGLVDIIVTADNIAWPGALIVGLLTGAQLPVVFKLVEKRLRTGGVCTVFPVHGSAGILGALLYPVFAVSLWRGGVSSVSLAVPWVIGVGVVAIWTLVAATVVFDGFHVLGQVRVSSDHERENLDTAEHGVDTYLEFGSPNYDIGICTGGSSVPSGDGFMTTKRED